MSSSAAPMPPGGFANVEDEPPQPSRKRGRSPEPAAPRAHLPRVLPAGTRAAILAAVAPGREAHEVDDYRRQVLAAGQTAEFVIPSQVRPLNFFAAPRTAVTR